MRVHTASDEIELPNDGDIQAIEEFLRTTCVGNDVPRITVPGVPSAAPLGFKVSQLQALLTWAQTCPSPSITLRSDAFRNATVLSPLEIAAVRVSKSAFARGLTVEGRAGVVSNAIQSTLKLSLHLESSEPSPEYWLLVPDYTSQAFPRLLYTPGEQVKLAEAFYFPL